jgi:putative oxidoreductase
LEDNQSSRALFIRMAIINTVSTPWTQPPWRPSRTTGIAPPTALRSNTEATHDQYPHRPRRRARRAYRPRRAVHRAPRLGPLVFTPPGTVEFSRSIGLPGALTCVVFAAEVVGGALLVLGVRVRGVAMALTPILLDANRAHAGSGWLRTSAKDAWQEPVFLAVAATVQALLADGTCALRAAHAARRAMARRAA